MIQKSQKVHRCVLSTFVHIQWAQSSMRAILLDCAISFIFLISHGSQNVCCAMIAFVFFEIRFLSIFGDIHKVSVSISQYTIFAQLWITALMTDIQVYQLTITSSQGFIHNIFKA